jgi:hypothetical protein
VIAIILVGTTMASYGIAWLLGVPVLVPLLNTAASFPFMFLALKQGDVRLAIGRMLLWALTLGACATWLSYVRPAATGALFLGGEAYRTEMFTWVMTGRGLESTPSRFIPQHAAHAAVFVGLTLASGGLLAMPMGAVLMNYMGHYVGALAARSAQPALTMMLAWHPWAVVRVVSFVILGVAFSMPVLARVGRFRADWRAAQSFVIAATIGLFADVLMKWLLAPTWQRLLLRAVGW